MDMFDFAGLLFGGSRTAPQGRSVTATGAATSEDGVAGVTLDADVTPAEDVGEDADQTVIDLPTSPDVDEGDELIVTLVGDGPLKTPVVTANPGSGDRMRALANSAKTIANAAQAVAEAVNQHFWHDTSGAHVTEATQEEWEQSHSGPNSLWNSLGMLFRDGLNNLLALVTGSSPGVVIYDGGGNAASNVVSDFTADGVRFYDSGTVGMHVGSVNYNGATQYGLAGYDGNGVLSGILSVLSSGYMTVHGLAGAGISSGKAGASTTCATVDAEVTGISERFYKAGDAESAPSFTRSITANGFYEGSHAGSNTWSTPAGTVLWSSGGWAMAADQTANLAYNVSTCPTGIVLHWQPYTSSTVRNYFHHWQFVPKEQVASFAGTTVDVTLSSSKFASVATKTLYVSDNRVTGHADNTATGTANGITYNNAQWVLTQIIAV